MRTRPTPGPWHYEADARGNVTVFATRNGDDKIIIGMSHFGPLEQREADARLICQSVNQSPPEGPIMAVTHRYSAPSMADLADHLASLAAVRRKHAEHAARKALQKELRAEALGLETAAEIVRETKIAEQVSA